MKRWRGLRDRLRGNKNAPPSPRDPGIDLTVATSVLTVAQRLTSAELRRRLVEAIGALPDVTVIYPQPGTAFDPDRHTWADSVSPPTPDAEGTIAETRAAGLLDHHGTVRRRATVVVYQTRET